MASFGSFETEREIYSGQTYTVYSAKKHGDPKTEYAIKVFSVHHINLEPESAEQLDPLLSDIEKACVERIAMQQKAAAGSKLVAAIFESGRDERGVWYATTYYPRSVNKIISGRVALNREALQHIIASIAQGALDIKRACGRSHGEILPSNVQISRSEKLAEADVVLSDPMPGGEAEAARYELSDLRSIGRILLQLVSRREINHEEEFLILPILASPEWTQLFGKHTDAWLAICNKLLDPNLALEQLTLEQLVAELQALEPEKGIPPRLITAAAACVVVLAVVLFLIMRPRTQTVEVTSDPVGATILVDKKQQEGKAPLKLKFKKGNYTIEARQEGLTEQATNWVVQGGGTAKLHFQFPYGRVTIQSEPPGATVKRGGVEIGKTPLEIPAVAAGSEVSYELSKLEYAPKTVRGVVTNGQKLVLSETLLLSREAGTIDLDSTPRGAKVYLGDKILTEATPEQVQLLQGTYTLTARYKEADWPSKQIVVNVKKGEIFSTNIYFENARVSVESEPEGATVSVGTNQLGRTPVTALRPAGESIFHFELAGFDPTNATLLVADAKPGQRVRPSLQTSNGVFELTSDPPNARIFDATGKELGRTEAGKPVMVPSLPGTYQFLARIDGLRDVEATLAVAKRQRTNHVFHFDYGSVKLDSIPPGASISTNGKSIGVTPATFVQRPGVKVIYEIAALNYVPVSREVTVQSRQYDLNVTASLEREPVKVALASDPPGAEFYTDTGVPLKLNGGYCTLPWGQTTLIARHRRLGAQTNAFNIQPGNIFKADPFKFIYGKLILTNLEGYTIKDGGEEVQNASTSVPVSYEPPGPHVYDVYDGGAKVDTLTNIIEAGAFTVLTSAKAGDKRNGIGMKLVRVRNLQGPGLDVWVGKYEVTQGEYKAVMGANPSGHQSGDNYPVENVTWVQAADFCNKLNKMDKNPPSAQGSYSLPNAQQWAKFAGNPELKTAVWGATETLPGGSKPANGLGLYDILGNVREWLAGDDPKNKDYIGGGFRSRPGFGGMGAFTNAVSMQLDQASDDLGFRVIWIPSR